MFGTYAHYFYFCRGELAEWSIAAVLKTVDLSKGPRVRIPHSPPNKNAAHFGWHFLFTSNFCAFLSARIGGKQKRTGAQRKHFWLKPPLSGNSESIELIPLSAKQKISRVSQK